MRDVRAFLQSSARMDRSGIATSHQGRSASPPTWKSVATAPTGKRRLARWSHAPYPALMRGLRTLMLILLAAVFAVGGPLRALPCHAEVVPPCHEMAADMAGMAHDKAPAHKSKPAAMALSCCAGCLPA